MKFKATNKKWLKKLMKKSKKCTTPISYEKYIHEDDKKTLSVLKVIPFFDKICSKFISIFNESQHNVLDMSCKVKITKTQLPRIYEMVEVICLKLGIDFPNLFLELNREPNAYTYGDKTATISITSGLLECLEDDEIFAVLAHECGHIACKHVLYHTMGQFILNGGIAGISLLDRTGWLGTAISIPLKLAFYNWMRCSELSADRAATLCCETSTPVIETMMRLAGGTWHVAKEIDTQQFIEQASNYKDLTDQSKWSKTLEFLMVSEQTHPLLSVRARLSREWAQTRSFESLVNSMYQ